MATFWRHGYDETSTPRLEAALGVARSSIANTFGKKHELLLECLDRYLELTESTLIAPLHDPLVPGLEACARFFEDLSALKSTDPGRHGCLMINCATQLGSGDPEVAHRFHRYRVALSTGFSAALTRARTAGASAPQGAEDLLLAVALAINLEARASNPSGVSRMSQSAGSIIATWG